MVWWCPSVRPGLIRPSSDGTYYGMVMSVRPSGSPSVRPSIRPSQFSAPFSYMLWDIKLKFCVSLYFDTRKIKFECHQFPSIIAGVMPLLNFTLLQICSFPHISHTCFVILSWNFAYGFVLLYFRPSSSFVNLRQFLLELRPSWNLEYWKYTVFRTFLLQALTYLAEILHMTLFYFTTDQVWVSLICVNFCWSYAPFGTYNTGNTQFSTLFSYIVGVMPLLKLSFPHFSLTCFDILSWNFAHDFV